MPDTPSSSSWKTLRFRLAVWNAIVVALSVVIILLGLRHGVRTTLLNEFDQILSEDLREIELALAELPQGQVLTLYDELNRKAVGHRHHGWFVQLFDPNAKCVWASVNTPDQSLLPSQVLQDGSSTFGEFRFVQQSLETPHQPIARIRIGATTSFLGQDVAKIDRWIWIAAGSVLIAAPVLGFWMARRAASSIGAIIASAAKMRPHRMQERLPIRGSGDELDQLARTVNGLLDRISAHLDRNRDFLANAAHELRTPLAAIRSSVEVALATGRSRDEYEELLVTIINQSATLELLVNQLLLIAESENERLMNLNERVQLDQLVQRSLAMFAGVAEAKNVVLTSKLAPVVVAGNLHLLRQLINNLVDNAIKYTEPAGRVTVELCRQTGGQRAILRVRDTGIGISSHDLPHIFDRFYRADQSRTRLGEVLGTGLGLSICEAVVKAHEGTIRCESVVNRGTIMTVELPCTPAGETASIGTTPVGESLSTAGL